MSKAVFSDKHAKEIPLTTDGLFNVRGKVALVTGGSRGIGRMIAAGLIANGATVLICSRKAAQCEATAKELNAEYQTNRAISLPGDVSSLAGVQAIVDSMSAYDELHILVNNAGVTWGAPFDSYPDEAWQKVMDVNVRHVFNLTRLLSPKLQKASRPNDPARVVNVSSVDGVRAQQTFGPTAAFAYTVSKGAVNHLTISLCRALSGRGITVNCIAPGVFPSNMTKFMLASPEIADAQVKANPMGRVGRTADAAAAVLFLVGPGGSFCNGQIIALDGGQHLHDATLFAHM